MKVLGVSLALCLLLTTSQAGPLNFTFPIYTKSIPPDPEDTEPPPTTPDDPPAHLEGPRTHPDNSSTRITAAVSAQGIAASEPPPTNVTGNCTEQQLDCKPSRGTLCPKCDDKGHFLPQQCSGSTGNCWCINAITGEAVPGTSTQPGSEPLICEPENEGEEGNHKKTKKEESQEEDSDEQKEKYGKEKREKSNEEDNDEDSDEDFDEDSDEDNCPENWSSFQDQCYMYIETEKTWAEAQFYCQFDGANLASVHSPEENVFLQSLTRRGAHNFPETWLGGTDAILPKFWLWIDGSNFHYENWNHDDHEDEDEHCLKMNYEFKLKWTAASCNQTLPFVCSKSLKDDDDQHLRRN